MLYGIAAATASFLLAALLAPLLRAPALRLGAVERRRRRCRRRRPLPLSGGIAVVAATGLVAGAGEWTGVVPLGPAVGALLAAGAGVALLGLAADVWRLRRRWQAAGTAVAAACVVPYEETGPAAGALAVAWIVLVALAFQGLDHADGLAGAVGVVTAFGLAVCAGAELLDGLAVLLCALAAALAGFLPHNWAPARTGLGASGALSAGFVLAAAAVFTRAGHGAGHGAGHEAGHGVGSTAAVLFALAAPAVADVALVLLSRRLAGRHPLRPATDHLAHRLRRLGLTARGAALLPAVGTFGSVLVGVLVHTGRLGGNAVLWVAGVAIVGVLGLVRVGRPYASRRRRRASRGVRAAAAPAPLRAVVGTPAGDGFPRPASAEPRILAGQRGIARKERIRVESA
ncbi:undecaprenyl/decaprenyl-phosphate alpha-N-acetylglucosaminyl 1-phosphate transferase [Streptomyces sp. CRN 30]|uniref:undecaprenyl/decaprenyl-phosphate alpha-N-acetylglucosaminyl 1-phosphate transferase n=1 Tax=Streptomyces sp. CRN 30 TaxID=3075613 RepID=UPI002A828A90|nr:undecaprenyl/decaprenyl-phosphate alpha-N-acetylglucosaminyl 1-phosphate transferase [Streptomyces sp. CRN 30]